MNAPVQDTPAGRPRSRRLAEDPALAELFGGVDRYRAFRLLFTEPGRAFRARELAGLAGIDPGNTSRWLRRWAAAGLLEPVTRDGHPAWRVAADPRLAALKQVFETPAGSGTPPAA